jgi:hypothetical protein
VQVKFKNNINRLCGAKISSKDLPEPPCPRPAPEEITKRRRTVRHLRTLSRPKVRKRREDLRAPLAQVRAASRRKTPARDPVWRRDARRTHFERAARDNYASVASVLPETRDECAPCRRLRPVNAAATFRTRGAVRAPGLIAAPSEVRAHLQFKFALRSRPDIAVEDSDRAARMATERASTAGVAMTVKWSGASPETVNMVQKEGFLIKIAIVSMFISTGKAPSLITGAVTFSPGAAEPRAIIYFATERRAFDGRLNYDRGRLRPSGRRHPFCHIPQHSWSIQSSFLFKCGGWHMTLVLLKNSSVSSQNTTVSRQFWSIVAIFFSSSF